MSKRDGIRSGDPGMRTFGRSGLQQERKFLRSKLGAVRKQRSGLWVNNYSFILQ